ncbi:low molecular weight protein-tyrosine-phosphatase [Pseudazoarcus pumilus]|uniref:protein-tyrosine-phosphatase n=1 Tax=Pseudazoarcus pumilus TaxID=2067960 RepID=A0A2I6S517_9RHOO|nr:low molecular weight protein-tyrosine-phosphatase [Pseudazoarcus pumilus]AUN94356.1 phosphotyrosine protein phosphatase [Pseudazoarcus pumilus]
MSAQIVLPEDRPLRVLFVCTGNICRSPTAEAVARRLFAAAGLDGRVEFDSAGTHGYHVGEAPDPRAMAFAAKHGYDLSGLRARRVEVDDFARFDLLLAMDRGHHAQMLAMCPTERAHRVAMFTGFADEVADRDVPDPYYGGEDGFREVLDLCERGVRGLLGTVETGR